ncbi:hypothetical protein BGX26_006838 [Mortierella sp. AD094]|nr:hypothetical protein BGX26_006838 [Mortierella sp. AD094]
MTDQEEQDMSFAVFKQLARLRKLKILDLDSSSSPPTSLLFTTSMGLQMLYSLADLEVLRLPGKQDLTLQDVDWMFKSWESLKTVNAERLAASRSQITTEVWSHIELGSNSRIIQLTLQELSSKASCIRALDFMDCESTIRFSLIGKGCTQLRALAIAIAPEDAARGKKYWSACEELIREIPTTLETLTFRLMPILGPEFEGDSFDWTLLLNIAHYLLRNLRALRLQYCQLPHHYIDAFLDICEQLQVSELQDVPFELPQLPTTGEPQSVNKRVVRLSNLLELTLVNSGPMDFLAQLEMIVRQAPKLKKLCWEVQRFLEARFRVNGFMYLFSGQAKYQHTPAPEDSRVVSLALCTAPCWPDLESLALKGNFHLLSSEQYLKIVEMSKTFRALDMPMYPMRSTIVDSIVRLHSRTLTEIVWNAPHEHNDVAWVQQILSSCPRLVKGYFRGILAQDIVVGGDSWVCCDSLEELRLNIIMGRPLDITYQDMAKAVFKQLARLHRLRILDMDSSMNHPGIGSATTPMETKFDAARYRLDDGTLEVIEDSGWNEADKIAFTVRKFTEFLESRAGD